MRSRAALVGPVLALLVLMGLSPVAPQTAAVPPLPAFPSAEGFGAGATGGRGGQVYIVNTLEPFGAGSLGDGLAPPAGSCAPRTIVFAVSGVIEVPGKHDLELTCGNVTIAGQTAPGGGITLHGRLDAFNAKPSGNIIIRHLRIRPVPITNAEGAIDQLGASYDALKLSNNSRVIIDHVSMSWASDENLELFDGGRDATIQWSTIEESSLVGQPEGPHNYGIIAGPDYPNVTIHHVLCAHHRARCPALGAGPAQFFNSVVYDARDGFVHHNDASGEFQVAGNTFIDGPSSDAFVPLLLDDETVGGSTYWLSQNDVRAPGVFEGVLDGILGNPIADNAFPYGQPGAAAFLSAPTDLRSVSPEYQPVTLQTPAAAYEAVLAGAGAFPRDAITKRTVQDVRDGSGSWGVNTSTALMEGLRPAPSPPDADRDGMADAWESANGLNAGDPNDHATVTTSGYTAIEMYVNGLSDALVGASAPGPTGSDGPVATGGAAPSQAGPRTTPRPAATGTAAGSSGVTVLLAAAAAVLSAVAAVLSAISLYIVRARRRDGPPPET